MLDFAQRRADRLGLINLSFREADANALEVPEQPYDAILCRWGLMFMQDLKATLQSFHALLKPGGRVVAAIWGPPEDAPALSMGNRIVLSALDLPPPNEGAGTPFALSDVDAATKTFGEAGFRDVSGEWLPVTYIFESVDEFIQFRRERSKPLEDRIAHFPSAKRDAAWQKVGEAARTFADTAGAVRMTNKAYVIAAWR
jgi:ubiquinone/menaquinone biosynthesis C-methylase UbiE